MNGQKVERRKVKLGLDNNRMACIEEGLQPGELVLLAPPLAADQLRGGSQGNGRSEWENLAGDNQTSSETLIKTEPGEAQPPQQSLANDAVATPEAPPAQVEEPRRPGGEGLLGGDLGERFRNATPEERERKRQEMEQRLQNMSPDERQQFIERMQRSRGNRPPRREQQEPAE